MHEIGIVKAMVSTVTDFAKNNSIGHIESVVLQIGELSLIIPEYVTEIYPLVVKETIMEDTKLEIEIVPGMAECGDCDEVYNLIENEGVCPECGSRLKTVFSGRDFIIKELRVPE
ncbi:MAG: hydrogenase maturation nickel metallochaperone HypA [Clostridia bacterium]|nr:hydrogenase maturation nickel metallochaperone HypA [Clostridia bacterium]